MVIVTLETDRLRLRPFAESDLDAYFRICSDPETMRYIGLGNTMTREDAWRSIAFLLGHWHLRGYGMWAVEEKKTGTLVGRIGLYNPESWPGLEVGWLIDRQSWGAGFAPEGAQAAIDFAFNQLGASHLLSLIQTGNRASMRVAEKLGMAVERNILLNGVDVVVYGLDRNSDK